MKAGKIKPVLSGWDPTLLEQVHKDGFASVKEKNPGLEPNFFPVGFHTRSDGSMDMVLEYLVTSGGEKATFFIAGTLLDCHYKNEQLIVLDHLSHK